MDPDLALFALAFSPADGTLASGGVGRRLALHDRTTWTPSDFLTLERPRMVAALAWSPDGSRLAVGDIDDASLSKGTIEIRNRGTRDLVARLDTAGAPASALAFVSADMVVGAFGRELRAWRGLR
jgi:WD40 repeat protein